VEWIHLAERMVQWQALVNTVINSNVPQKVGNYLARWATISFSVVDHLFHLNTVLAYSAELHMVEKVESFTALLKRLQLIPTSSTALTVSS